MLCGMLSWFVMVVSFMFLLCCDSSLRMLRVCLRMLFMGLILLWLGKLMWYREWECWLWLF